MKAICVGCGQEGEKALSVETKNVVTLCKDCYKKLEEMKLVGEHEEKGIEWFGTSPCMVVFKKEHNVGWPGEKNKVFQWHYCNKHNVYVRQDGFCVLCWREK